jgi:hypothetical protein
MLRDSDNSDRNPSAVGIVGVLDSLSIPIVIPYAKIVGILVCLTKKYPFTYFFNSYIVASSTLISTEYIVFVSLDGEKETTPFIFS